MKTLFLQEVRIDLTDSCILEGIIEIIQRIFLGNFLNLARILLPSEVC